MDGGILIETIQFCTILIGFVGIAATMRNHQRQMHAQFFIEFSSRLHEVLRTLPWQTWTAHTSRQDELPPPNEELTKSCLLCFHIVADIYRLQDAGLVSKSLWIPWEQGIGRVMANSLFRREWLVLEAAFDFNPTLQEHLRSLIADSRKQQQS